MHITKVEGIGTVKRLIVGFIDDFYDSQMIYEMGIDNYADKLEKNADIYMVCENQDVSPVGIIMFYCNDMETKTAFLSSIVVKQKHRRQGVGKLLLKKMESECRKCGMKKIQLEVNVKNTKAIHLYEKLNYRLSDEQSDKKKSCHYKMELIL